MPPVTSLFERLEKTATFIIQHPDYPGKKEVVADCLEDIEERWQKGQLLLEQRFRLYAILLKVAMPRLPLSQAV
jgi:hypothetical protein